MEQIQHQAKKNQRLSAQVAELKGLSARVQGLFEWAMAAQCGSRSLADAFNR